MLFWGLRGTGRQHLAGRVWGRSVNQSPAAPNRAVPASLGQSQTEVLQHWFCPGTFIPSSAASLIPSALSAPQQLARLEGNSKMTGMGEVLVPTLQWETRAW